MDWEELKVFFEKRQYLKEEKPGLYRLLMYPYFREKYEVSLEEAEYLTGVEIAGPANYSTQTWAGELLKYREERK